MKTLNNSDKKVNPFKVPENYFENFKMDMMDKLPEKRQTKTIPLWRKVLPWTAVAAVFSGIMYFSGILNYSPSNTRMSDSLYEDDYLDFVEEQNTESMYKAMFFEEEY